MEVLYNLVDTLHLCLGRESRVTSMKGVYDLCVPLERSGVRCYLFISLIDLYCSRGRVDRELFSHQVVGDRVGVGIKDHHGSLSGSNWWMDRDIPPWYLWKWFQSFFFQRISRSFSCRPVDGMILIIYPLVESLVYGLEGGKSSHTIEEGTFHGTYCPFHPAFFISTGRVTEAYLNPIVTTKVQKTGIILDLGSSF